MTSVSNRIVSHLQVIGKGDISASTTHRLMALLRQLMEERSDAHQYPTLNLFCDWSLHTRLDRSKMGAGLLDLLDQMWANSRQVDQQVQEIITKLSPRTLQIQTISLLAHAFIWPGAVDNPQMFNSVIGYLYLDLVGKPIVRKPNEEAKLISKRIASGFRFMAKRISFEDIEGDIKLTLVAQQVAPTIGGEVRVQIPWRL